MQIFFLPCQRFHDFRDDFVRDFRGKAVRVFERLLELLRLLRVGGSTAGIHRVDYQDVGDGFVGDFKFDSHFSLF